MGLTEAEHDDSGSCDAEPSSQNSLPLRHANFIDHPTTSAAHLDDLLRTHLPLGIDWSIDDASCTFLLPSLRIQITNTPVLEVTASSGNIPRKWLDPLRVELRRILREAVGGIEWSGMKFGVLLLQIGEEAAAHVAEFEKSQEHQNTDFRAEKHGWDASSTKWHSILEDPLGVNLATVNDTARFLLGKPITDILADLPAALRVLHVEPVFRNDLVLRFSRRRRAMKEKMMEMNLSSLRKCVDSRKLRSGEVHDSLEGIAEHLTTPHITFHGAPRNVISSIVRYGFVIPGHQIGKTGVENQIACGASYGVGIYSSPSIHFASSYARSDGILRHPAEVPGLRMIVCAVLMGRPLQVTREATRRTEGISNENADSHVSPNKLEYIVFDSAQIIPCYVLHMDYGAEEARRHFDLYMNDPTTFAKYAKSRSRIDTSEDWREASDPGAIKAKKEALKAAAAKWFPYGYGPATGTSFVIEEIGEVSDDEEDYGEFQALRGEEADAYGGRAEDEKESWFDQFQTVRRTKREVRVER